MLLWTKYTKLMNKPNCKIVVGSKLKNIEAETEEGSEK
jgi:hypothetical protein